MRHACRLRAFTFAFTYTFTYTYTFAFTYTFTYTFTFTSPHPLRRHHRVARREDLRQAAGP